MATFGLHSVAHLMQWQDGVVSRRQLLDAGALPHDVRRLLRRRELTAHHPGTYVNHTGPLTWDQRAWAAVLHHAPAALCDESALPHPRPVAPINVAVAVDRSIKQVDEVEARRMAHLDERLHPSALPPCVRIEHAAIDVALKHADVANLFQVFADVCQTRRTTASHIRAAAATRLHLPRRALLTDLLDDLDKGACSVLEREYLRLERLHGLPHARRQRRDSLRGRASYRDALAKIGLLLQPRGWTGDFLRCPDCP